MTDLDWRPDILGAGYSQLAFDLGPDPDGEGTATAVLVRRDPGPGDSEPARGAVLYVHGFTDYFFQRDLADFFAARGLAFYALDLRKCGRARQAGQTPHFVSALELYDAELDAAMEVITAAHPGVPVILAAHSTGGLVIPLWLDRARRQRPARTAQVAAVVLNSPWLELQGSSFLRGPVTQLMRPLGKAWPFHALALRPGIYGHTLHVSGAGEWDYDLDLKPLDGFPVTFGWLNAIRRGHARLHRGIETGVPTLVLRSARSRLGSTSYGPASDRADLVLDTEQIRRWAPALGSAVTDMPVDGARHDVFLSLPQPRAAAYAALDGWLASQGLAALAGRE